jgi:eukaryotic-like serine/threonine-protein kinase
MSPEHWKEVERLYHLALELPPNEREEFLTRACPHDDVRREVESLLFHPEQPRSDFDQSALDDTRRGGQSKTLVGSTIGPYQVLAFLAAGGMGEVYRARHTKLHRDVALKVLPSGVSHDPVRRRASELEAKLLASLNHANIAAIYDLIESDGIQCLVLEYVEGQTLAERLKRKRLPVSEALEIARQIAEALEYAHEQGIIHRDLKPGNVMITLNGTVKVLDFGIARILHGQTSGDDATTAQSTRGAFVGTPAYMSPEQVKGKQVGRTSDIWAFGCVLFEMLAGRRAFDGDSVAEVLGRVLDAEPDWTAAPVTFQSQPERAAQRRTDSHGSRSSCSFP